MPSCEIKILFKNETEPVILRDIELIKEIPVVARAVLIQNPNWETEDTVIEEVLEVPSFTKETADFLFEYLRKFVPPDEVEDPSIEQNFKEADGKTLDELKEILELASFFECIDFMSSIAFIVARKLEPMPVEEIAEFMGLDPVRNPDCYFFNSHGWIHAPVDAVKKTE